MNIPKLDEKKKHLVIYSEHTLITYTQNKNHLIIDARYFSTTLKRINDSLYRAQIFVTCFTSIIFCPRMSCYVVSIRSGSSKWRAKLLFFWQQRRLKLLGRIVAANGPAATSQLPLAA